MEFGFKHCFSSSVFWKNSGFSCDTKLTWNFRGWGRWCVYLFSSEPVRYSPNYLTMPFWQGYKAMFLNWVLFISSEYSVNSTSLHLSYITVRLLCLYINICLILQLFHLFFFLNRNTLGIDEKHVKECGITILFPYQVYSFWRK